MPALHYDDDFGPAQVAGRDAYPGPRLGTGRAGLIVRMVIKKPLGDETAPLILAADEEEFQ